MWTFTKIRQVGAERADKWTKLTRLIADVDNVWRARLKLSQHDAPQWQSGSYGTGFGYHVDKCRYCVTKVVLFSAYIQIKNDNHKRKSDIGGATAYKSTRNTKKRPALTYKISLWIRTGMLHSCTGIHTCCMLLMETSQRTWKLSDGTAVFNYTQQAEAELGVRTWHGDTLQQNTQFPPSICFSMLYI